MVKINVDAVINSFVIAYSSHDGQGKLLNSKLFLPFSPVVAELEALVWAYGYNVFWS